MVLRAELYDNRQELLASMQLHCKQSNARETFQIQCLWHDDCWLQRLSSFFSVCIVEWLQSFGCWLTISKGNACKSFPTTISHYSKCLGAAPIIFTHYTLARWLHRVWVDEYIHSLHVVESWKFVVLCGGKCSISVLLSFCFYFLFLFKLF